MAKRINTVYVHLASGQTLNVTFAKKEDANEFAEALFRQVKNRDIVLINNPASETMELAIMPDMVAAWNIEYA